jgi:hypothetical protein
MLETTISIATHCSSDRIPQLMEMLKRIDPSQVGVSVAISVCQSSDSMAVRPPCKEFLALQNVKEAMKRIQREFPTFSYQLFKAVLLSLAFLMIGGP